MADDFYSGIYNPDVLSCIANLSNDEVFTPPDVANAMLNLLPTELFASTETTFLDPACKSGVFLREIAKRLLAAHFPNYKEALDAINAKKSAGTALTAAEETYLTEFQAGVDHIFHHQLFGIAITELTSLLSRRGVYCSKFPNGEYSVSHFDDAEGNIRFKRIQHRWKDGKCVFCGASQSQYDRDESLETHAYEWIHTTKPEEILKMKFDVIISNPPYQLSDGGAGPSAMPLYNRFVDQAKKLNPRYITMIIPARWYAGGKGLDEFRSNMLGDSRIRQLTDFESSKDCFEGVDIAGGICYFLWDRDHKGNCHVVNKNSVGEYADNRLLDEYPIFIRSNEAVSILRKVLSQERNFMDQIVSSQKPFGFRTYARGKAKPFPGSIKLLSSQGIGYVDRSEVTKNEEYIDKYKVIIGRLVPSNGELDVKPGEGYRVMTSTRILKPGEINTESYITLGCFTTEGEIKNFDEYVRCKLSRFLLRQAISSVNINREVFKFVPLLDYSKRWTDEILYQKYKLSEDEIQYVENLIRPLDCAGGIEDA